MYWPLVIALIIFAITVALNYVFVSKEDAIKRSIGVVGIGATVFLGLYTAQLGEARKDRLAQEAAASQLAGVIAKLLETRLALAWTTYEFENLRRHKRPGLTNGVPNLSEAETQRLRDAFLAVDLPSVSVLAELFSEPKLIEIAPSEFITRIAVEESRLAYYHERVQGGLQALPENKVTLDTLYTDFEGYTVWFHQIYIKACAYRVWLSMPAEERDASILPIDRVVNSSTSDEIWWEECSTIRDPHREVDD